MSALTGAVADPGSGGKQEQILILLPEARAQETSLCHFQAWAGFRITQGHNAAPTPEGI